MMKIEPLFDYDALVAELPYHQSVAFYNYTGRGIADSKAYALAKATNSLDELRITLGVPGYEQKEVVNA